MDVNEEKGNGTGKGIVCSDMTINVTVRSDIGAMLGNYNQLHVDKRMRTGATMLMNGIVCTSKKIYVDAGAV